MDAATRACRVVSMGLVLLALVGGCSDGVTVVVNVSGITSDLIALEVSSTLDGKSGSPGVQQLNGVPSSFEIKLPAATVGEFAVSVTGLTGRQDLGYRCVVTEGVGAVIVQGLGSYHIDIQLGPGASPGCGLTVDLVGLAFGTVTSEPLGIACSKTTTAPVTCSGHFPVGTQVTLKAAPDKDSYFGSWAGECDGTGPCALSVGNGTRRVVANLVPPPVCTGARWCWDNPLPAGSPIVSVWGSSSNDVWAVGMDGLILHWNGSFWGPFPSTTTAYLSDVWGSGPRDLWAVGVDFNLGTGKLMGSVILLWNGAVWASALVLSDASTLIGGVWGSGPRDVRAVGESLDPQTPQVTGSVSLHWDGEAWAPVPTGAPGHLGRAWGSGPRDVWAVGSDGTVEQDGMVLHWDGEAWTAFPSGTRQILYGVWGSSAQDVWAVGLGGTVVHWNGSSWTAVPSGTTDDLSAVWGSGPQDAWAVGGTVDGMPVIFSVADVEMQPTAGAALLSPWQLATTAGCHPSVELGRVLVLLQSLDQDGDLSNGIDLAPYPPGMPIRPIGTLGDADIAAVIAQLIPGRTVVPVADATNRFIAQMDGEVWSQLRVETFGPIPSAQRSQGATTDGGSWYFSWRFGLQKTDFNYNILVLAGGSSKKKELKFLCRGS